MITIRNLTKHYKKIAAVDDVSLDVPDGALYGLIGLNGAGKTTIIKSISGLLKKFSGTIEVNSKEWGTLDYRRSFAFQPELFTPHQYLTGWEYLTFLQTLQGEEINRDKILQLCAEVGFDENLLTKKTRTYSKGTAQKLGLVQTISTSTPLVILDEPMSGLDPLARAQFKSVLKRANAEGRTIFLSTHILHDIDTLCSHLGILHKGHLLLSDTPGALKTKHNTDSLENAFLKEIGL